MLALTVEAMFWIGLSSVLSLLTGIGIGVFIADHWSQKDHAG